MKKQLIASALFSLFMLPVLASADATSTATTTPVSGSCGASNTLTLSSVQTTGLCATGTSTAVTGSGPWNWTCLGTSASTTASCSAAFAATSSASFTNTPTCTIALGQTTCMSPITWTSANVTSVKLTDCNGGVYETTGAGAQSDNVTIPFTSGCYQIRVASTSAVLATVTGTSTCTSGSTWNGSICVAIPTAVNGSCGTSNNAIVSVIPTTGLCSVGTSTSVTGSGPWLWNCSGINGGAQVSCAATFATSTTATSTTATSTTATSTAVINQTFVLCSQVAILKRDTALVSARSIYNTAMTQALQARTTQETAAIALSDATARQNALKAAANAYRTSAAIAQNALQTARQVILKTYDTEIKACKDTRASATTNAEKRKKENEKRRNDDRKQIQQDFKNTGENLRNEYKKKFEDMRSKFRWERGNNH